MRSHEVELPIQDWLGEKSNRDAALDLLAADQVMMESCCILGLSKDSYLTPIAGMSQASA